MGFNSEFKGLRVYGTLPHFRYPLSYLAYCLICGCSGLLDVSVVDGRGFEFSYMHGYLSSWMVTNT